MPPGHDHARDLARYLAAAPGCGGCAARGQPARGRPGAGPRAPGRAGGVTDVHDLHAWTITSGLPVLSAHVVVDPEVLAANRSAAMLDALQDCLRGHFDVVHSTFQLEPAGHAEHEPSVCL